MHSAQAVESPFPLALLPRVDVGDPPAYNEKTQASERETVRSQQEPVGIGRYGGVSPSRVCAV